MWYTIPLACFWLCLLTKGPFLLVTRELLGVWFCTLPFLWLGEPKLFLFAVWGLSVAALDFKYKEVPWFTYYGFIAWLLLYKGFLAPYAFQFLFCYSLFWGIDKLGALTMGGADIKCLLLMMPSLPLWQWQFYMMGVCVTGLLLAAFYRLRLGQKSFPFLPAIMSTYMIQIYFQTCQTI